MMQIRLRSGVPVFLLCYCLAAAQLPAANRIAQLSSGTVSGKMYHNVELGLRYELPNGWVVGDPSGPSEADHQFVWTDDPSAKVAPKEPSRCAKNLLFVTEHPEGMAVNGFNSLASVIAIDPIEYYII